MAGNVQQRGQHSRGVPPTRESNYAPPTLKDLAGFLKQHIKRVAWVLGPRLLVNAAKDHSAGHLELGEVERVCAGAPWHGHTRRRAHASDSKDRSWSASRKLSTSLAAWSSGMP